MKLFRIFFISTILAFSQLFAQLEIEISNGMTVETTGDVYISGASDVIENGSGYLKGVVESSTLSNAIQFAGLNLSNGFSGTITRTTGSAISASSPKTAFRSYAMDNSSGSALTTNVDAEIISGATNNEENGITNKFIYLENGGNFTGYIDNGSTENTIKAADVIIPMGVSNILISEGVGVGAKIYLEGPYQGGATPLADNLGTLPSQSPYTEAPRTASNIPTEAVDWVLVELRSGSSAGTSLGYRSAFINADGNIINDNGSLGIGFPSTPGFRYLVIKHRNHLPVMSNGSINYDWYSN